MKRERNYKNFVLIGSGPLDRCLASAKEFETLTEAKNYAKQFYNVHVYRGYFSKTDGSLMHYKEF